MDPRRIVYVVVGCLCILIGIFAEGFHTATLPMRVVSSRIGRFCFYIVGALVIALGLFAEFSN